MKKIRTFSLTALLESASVAFHSSLAAIIAPFATIVSTLGSLLPDYNASIETQQRAGSKDVRLANTRSIAEMDKTRDTYLRRFFKYVAELLRSPDATEKANAQIVNDAIARFRGLMDYEMNKQTVEVQNMTTALRANNVMQAVDDLALTDLVDKIADANTWFQGEMDARVMDESKKEKLNTVQQRKTTEGLYAQIIEKINAMANLMPTAETDECIDQINALIDQYARIITHMRAGGSGNEKLPKKTVAEKDDDTTDDTPTTPTHPTDPPPRDEE